MRILVDLPDTADRIALCNMLQVWMELSCACVDIVTAGSGASDAPCADSIVFWDLDSSKLPPRTWDHRGNALFLCS